MMKRDPLVARGSAQSTHDVARCPCCGQVLPDPAGVIIDPAAGLVSRFGRAAHLSPQQLLLLEALREAFPGLATEEALRTRVVGSTRSTVRRVIFETRQRLRPLGIEIVNAHGYGYRLAGLA